MLRTCVNKRVHNTSNCNGWIFNFKLDFHIVFEALDRFECLQFCTFCMPICFVEYVAAGLRAVKRLHTLQ